MNLLPSILSFEEWHHASCREHSITHLTTVAPARFQARLSTRRLRRFTEGFERLEADEVVGVERDRTAIEKDTAHPFVLFAVLEGEVSFEQNGRALRAAAGDMFLYDQGSPFTMTLRGTRRSAYQVPRDCVEESFAAEHVARLARPGAASTMLARSVLEHLACPATIVSDEARENLAQSLLDLFSASFPMSDHVRPRDTLLAEVKTWMRARSSEAGLDIDAVSRAFGVSVRTVNRLFAAEGTTPMRWLWGERLMMARAALHRNGGARMSEIATAAGFSDLAQFSRAFKRAFGAPPSSARSRIRADGPEV